MGTKYPIIKFFEFEHLPPFLRVVSEKFYTIAHQLANSLPECEETEQMLRKLLEAKDCAVRAELSRA